MGETEEKTEEMTVLNFRVPLSLKKMLEAYARQNGYSVSYILRKIVEEEIVSPELPLSSDLWKDMLQWRNDINNILERLIDIIDKLQKDTKKDLKGLYDIAKSNLETQKLAEQYLEKVDTRIKSLEFTNKVIFKILEKMTNLPIREIMIEELKAKEKGKEKHGDSKGDK